MKKVYLNISYWSFAVLITLILGGLIYNTVSEAILLHKETTNPLSVPLTYWANYNLFADNRNIMVLIFAAIKSMMYLGALLPIWIYAIIGLRKIYRGLPTIRNHQKQTVILSVISLLVLVPAIILASFEIYALTADNNEIFKQLEEENIEVLIQILVYISGILLAFLVITAHAISTGVLAARSSALFVAAAMASKNLPNSKSIESKPLALENNFQSSSQLMQLSYTQTNPDNQQTNSTNLPVPQTNLPVQQQIAPTAAFSSIPAVVSSNPVKNAEAKFGGDENLRYQPIEDGEEYLDDVDENGNLREQVRKPKTTRQVLVESKIKKYHDLMLQQKLTYQQYALYKNKALKHYRIKKAREDRIQPSAISDTPLPQLVQKAPIHQPNQAMEAVRVAETPLVIDANFNEVRSPIDATQIKVEPTPKNPVKSKPKSNKSKAAKKPIKPKLEQVVIKTDKSNKPKNTKPETAVKIKPEVKPKPEVENKPSENSKDSVKGLTQKFIPENQDRSVSEDMMAMSNELLNPTPTPTPSKPGELKKSKTELLDAAPKKKAPAKKKQSKKPKK